MKVSRLISRLLVGLLVAGAGCAKAGSSNGVMEPPTDAGSTGAGGSSSVIVDAAAGLGGSTGLGGSSGTGGSGASTDGGATDAGVPHDASADGAPVGGVGGSSGGCSISVTPESAPTLDTLEAYPGAHARFSASVLGARNPPVTLGWTVKLTGQPGTIPTAAQDARAARVEFPVESEGHYQIAVQALGEPTCPTPTIFAIAQRAVFVLRTSTDSSPVQDKSIALAGIETVTTTGIQLDPGMDQNIAPTRAADGTALASYVRVTQPASNLRIEGDTTRSALLARVLPLSSYDLLIVPNEAYAPALFTGLPRSWPPGLPVDQGTPVTAVLHDGAGNLLVGARMILRSGLLPSTVGTSDAHGAMTLRARAGTWAAFIVPPDASGLPQVSLGTGGDPGIVLPESAESLDLQVSWDAVDAAPLSVEVRDIDGIALVAGARVRVTSLAAAAPVATVVARPALGATVTLRASGSVDVEAVTDASGVAAFGSLPVGGLQLTVIPAAVAGGGAPTAAITSATVTLPPGGLVQTVALTQKVIMTGLLLPVPDSVGARVTAVDRSLTAAGTVATATVDAFGSYSLLVDPGRGYQLFVDPAPGVPRARSVLGVFISGSGTTTLRTQILPVGHLVQGTVMANGAAVPAARVQAFCPVWSQRCSDPTFSLADAVTDRDGRFELRVPDPGAN